MNKFAVLFFDVQNKSAMMQFQNQIVSEYNGESILHRFSKIEATCSESAPIRDNIRSQMSSQNDFSFFVVPLNQKANKCNYHFSKRMKSDPYLFNEHWAQIFRESLEQENVGLSEFHELQEYMSNIGPVEIMTDIG